MTYFLSELKTKTKRINDDPLINIGISVDGKKR